MNDLQRWFGRASFILMCLIGWCLYVWSMQPVQAGPLKGFLVGMVTWVFSDLLFSEWTEPDKTPNPYVNKQEEDQKPSA